MYDYPEEPEVPLSWPVANSLGLKVLLIVVAEYHTCLGHVKLELVILVEGNDQMSVPCSERVKWMVDDIFDIQFLA